MYQEQSNCNIGYSHGVRAAIIKAILTVDPYHIHDERELPTRDNYAHRTEYRQLGSWKLESNFSYREEYTSEPFEEWRKLPPEQRYIWVKSDDLDRDNLTHTSGIPECGQCAHCSAITPATWARAVQDLILVRKSEDDQPSCPCCRDSFADVLFDSLERKLIDMVCAQKTELGSLARELYG